VIRSVVRALLLSLGVLLVLCAASGGTPLVRAGRFMPNEFEHGRIGTACVRHPFVRLAADTVPIVYGFAYTEPGMEFFPNTRRGWAGGCVSGEARFTEVAFCCACRVEQTGWLALQTTRRLGEVLSQPLRR